MSAIQMRITFQCVSKSDPVEIFKAVADALFDLESSSETLLDADITASFGENKVSLSIVGTGANIEDASANASSAIRAAIHASGVATPGWNQTVEVARHQPVFRFLEQTAFPA